MISPYVLIIIAWMSGHNYGPVVSTIEFHSAANCEAASNALKVEASDLGDKLKSICVAR